MEIKDIRIDNGKAFDWDKASADYAKYRDIYPEIFYKKIAERNLCVSGQRVLDLGTGTGVLPRNMYSFGAKWTGCDISAGQIEQAKRLSSEAGLDIEYILSTAEKIDFPDNTFDVITSCQCFWYFDHEKITPNLVRMLKNDGRLLILYMSWLPFEDEIAGESEKLILKYNPMWNGNGETVHPITVPDCVLDSFEPVFHEEYRFDIPFTKETWHGRMKACRGVEASLTAEETEKWEKEHRALLDRIAPESFNIKHYAASLELKPKK